MHLRPYAPHDISALTSILIACDETDNLSCYMFRDLDRLVYTHRQSCVRFLKAKVLSPSVRCNVVVADAGDAGARDRQVLGWVVYTRHGASAAAQRWAKDNEGWSKALERAWLRVQNAYASLPGFVQTLHAEHMQEVGHIMREDPSSPPDYALSAVQQAGSPPLEERIELDGLYVDPNMHRRGIGRLLVESVMQAAREDQVPITCKSSPSGVLIYSKMGFRKMWKQPFEPFFRVQGDGYWVMFWETSMS